MDTATCELVETPTPTHPAVISTTPAVVTALPSTGDGTAADGGALLLAPLGIAAIGGVALWRRRAA